jgi:uncharacterized protein
LLLWLALGWLPALAPAQGVLPLPELRARVMDQTGTLDATALAAIEERLATFEQAHGAQVVVLIIATTAPEDIADYTQRLGDAWKLGRRGVGDGLLFVIAKDDRRLRIAPAKSLEGAVPDLMARRILDQAVAPAFRQGDFAGGIRAGLEQILALIAGESLPPPTPASAGSSADAPWEDLFIFAVFALPILSGVLRGLFGTQLGSLLTGVAASAMAWHLTAALWIALAAGLVGLLVALLMQALPVAAASGGRTRNGSWGGHRGGWGGGSGGGGFGSGGGGNFGGGGASGGW